MKAEELLKEKNREAAAEKERKDASNDRAAQMELSPERDGHDGQVNENDADIEKNERSRNNDMPKSPSDDDLMRRDDNGSKGICSVSKLKKLQQTEEKVPAGQSN